MSIIHSPFISASKDQAKQLHFLSNNQCKKAKQCHPRRICAENSYFIAVATTPAAFSDHRFPLCIIYQQPIQA
jgi:hypothetical protein